ncbi:MAG: riboflavin synthase [Methyloceanibacter sp.]
MFTGIVSGIGTLLERQGQHFLIGCPYEPSGMRQGASIACDGCCLTLVSTGEAKGSGAMFAVDVSNETLAHTTLGDWREGRGINLERALSFRDELGGHLVTGHIDGRARILEVASDGESVRVLVEAPGDLGQFIAPKGSVTLDGVSLTVNEVDGARFGVNLIPYTLTHTTWGDRVPGDLVNLEVDPIARYVARLVQYKGR